MPLTMADLEDVQMQSAEKWRAFSREFDGIWFKPLRETMISGMLRSLDEPTKMQLQARVPDAMRAVEKRYGGNNGNRV